MSRLTGGPIVGAIAGNLLRYYSIEIDYRDGALTATRRRPRTKRRRSRFR